MDAPWQPQPTLRMRSAGTNARYTVSPASANKDANGTRMVRD